MSTVHVVGAGLAGLAAALRLAETGRRVIVHEAAGQAGGRCRSYFDRTLGCTIDNGNHLLLSGNRSARDYLRRVEAEGGLVGSPQALFPFVDLASGRRWTIRPNAGRLPWWILSKRRRVPGTRLAEYLGVWRLARAPEDATVGDVIGGRDALWRAFFDPLTRAVLNTPPKAASARLLGATLRESFALGGAGCRPLIARHGLSQTFVDPVLDRLDRLGGEVRFRRRLRTLERDQHRIIRLAFGDDELMLGDDDVIVLAVPAWHAAPLLPELAPPTAAHAIVNAHFLLEAPAALPGGSILLGVLGGTAEWLFARGRVISVTVSAADALAEKAADEVALQLWADTARALGLSEGPVPPWRIVKEKRATLAQTPDVERRRPPARTRWSNLILAGDWTATGLPATIEGAIRSGDTAAGALVNLR